KVVSQPWQPSGVVRANVMSLLLAVVGLVTTGAGAAAAAFGLSIPGPSNLAPVLVGAGAVAVSSGLVLLGLAATIAKLGSFAEALQSRSLDVAVSGLEPVVEPQRQDRVDPTFMLPRPDGRARAAAPGGTDSKPAQMRRTDPTVEASAAAIGRLRES